ncbi:hypothetical protein [Aquitalea pelogenes]|uniref:hypothetical protein n=1 Tax=Aquitalea pelogenes TaxID=1293573 RepID=UPI0035ADF5D1
MNKQLIDRGPVIGQFMGQDIPASLSYSDGSKYEFVRAGVIEADGGFEMEQLDDEEFVITPGLIYRRTR